jgi:hypothetical protein
MFLIPGELYARFGNSPFRVIESLIVSGRLHVQQRMPSQLDAIVLVGRACTVNRANLERVVQKIGPHKLASLVCAALTTERLGVSSPISGKRLFSALLDLIPPNLRPSFSLTTGLKVSATRDYRLALLPSNKEEHRHAIRQLKLDVMDLNGDAPTRFAPIKGWPQLVHQLLVEQQYQLLADMVETAAHDASSHIDVIAEQQRERLEQSHERAITPFPA